MVKREVLPSLEKLLAKWKRKIWLKEIDDRHKGLFKNKFIAIQIDALPYDILVELLNNPECRFIKSLVTDRHFFVSRYNCGLPSDTPTILAGMFYKASDEVVGFRSADKKAKRLLSFADPAFAYKMEQTLKKRNKGILTDGSSYLTTYSGDSKKSFLTMSQLTSRPTFSRVKEWNMMLLMLLNPFVLLRVSYISITEFLLEFYDSLMSFLHRVFIVKEKKASFRLIYPLRRFFYQGIVMEFQRLNVIRDMKLGSPRIYMNFHAYDDIMHRRGMKSKASLRVLKQIDRTIGRIYRKKPADYDFYLLSDHGAEDSAPFNSLYDESITDLLHRLTEVEVQESKGNEGWSTRMKRGAKMMEPGLTYLTWPIRLPFKMAMKFVSKGFRDKEREAIWKSKEQVILQNVGALGHVYFTISPDRLELSEIKRQYPKVIDGLVKHPGVGFLVVKDGEHTRVIAWNGEFVISNRQKAGKVLIVSKRGIDFLCRYGETDVLLEQLRSLSNRKNVGDLMLFGNYHDGKVVSFGEYYAAHGGAGKQMCGPFFMSKQGFDLSDVTRSDGLYDLFKKYL